MGNAAQIDQLVANIQSNQIPVRPLAAGEQYRFHFDMTKCIGCKCCVVACNEQNGNPAAINWRTVGDIEGGYYPYTQRYHLSMSCNHCLEPSCLIGCPVEAYTKDPLTGIVLHDPNVCIGCQYCTWNCSYGAPQYNAERGVVGKCDMCRNRIRDGMPPACVAACPENALTIEVINISEWRQDYLAANAPGLPSANDSISTTRVTLPEHLAPDTGRVDVHHVAPEHPHWPLVFMLVLTQLSVGAFAVIWLLQILRYRPAFITAAISLALAGISLSTSIAHLGRPIYALRALKGLRRSWLSREVLALSLFTLIAGLFTAFTLIHSSVLPVIGLFTVLTGLAGLMCSARIYMVRARPAWNSGYTVAEFFSTAALLGALSVGTVERHPPVWLYLAASLFACSQFSTQALKLLWLARSDIFELRGVFLLLSGRLRNAFLIRMAILIAATAVPLIAQAPRIIAMLFAIALIGELLGRYLFFVSVVPKKVAAAFPSLRRRAA